MPNCIDCLHFKMKKGWRNAFCSQHLILKTDGQDRLFDWEFDSNKKSNRKLKPEFQENLSKRAYGMVTLNHPLGKEKGCLLFEGY